MANPKPKEKVEVTITRDETRTQRLLDGTVEHWKIVRFSYPEGAGRITIREVEATPEEIQKRIRAVIDKHEEETKDEILEV